MSNNQYINMPDFSKVFEAWDQKTTVTGKGWTYAPQVGTFGEGWSSHNTYTPEGKFDHYSVYNGKKRVDQKKF